MSFLFEVRIGKTVEDAKAIAFIHSEAFKATYKNIIHSSYLDKISPESRYKSAVRRLQREDLLCLIVVEIETGKIVGFADFGPNREKSIDADYELYAIYLLKEFQGLGAGQLIFQYGVRHLSQLNCKKMMISVLEKNKAAQFFYEKMGAVRTRNHYVEIEGIRYPTVTYILETL
jgi:ribosomal protein S18 acetylase RimI-like enzyme